jgi:hypothetical protein
MEDEGDLRTIANLKKTSRDKAIFDLAMVPPSEFMSY